MRREEIVELCEKEVLDRAAKLFGTQKDALKVFEDYEGCANLVYEYQHSGLPTILRISFRSDRTRADIEAELDYINYLATHGVRVSKPVMSVNGLYLETVETADLPFHVTSFVKGRGMRVPDNGYRYRSDAPIDEYFQNWGHVLGQMHALTKAYVPPANHGRRLEWFALHSPEVTPDAMVPERYSAVRDKILAHLEVIKSLPKDKDAYGLIHGDFNDGNFTVDYTNGDITVFDFDDACYFWFVYELASAWEGGVGRIMFRGLHERKAFMDHYFEKVLEGYNRENTLSDQWVARLPLFLKLIQIEEFLYFVRYIDDGDEEIQAGLNYKMKCIEEDIPYLGFFDSLYSPERPFQL
jgi:Ser/Thr protein kinase RdoA (MazF antagonist)